MSAPTKLVHREDMLPNLIMEPWWCQGCSSKYVAAFCKNCRGIFCNVCVIRHISNPGFSQHVQCPISKVRFCKFHLNLLEEQTKFCKTCNEKVCVLCVGDHHKSHDTCDLTQAVHDVRKQAADNRETYSKVVSEYNKLCTAKIAKIDQNIRSVKQSSSDILVSVKNLAKTVEKITKSQLQHLQMEKAEWCKLFNQTTVTKTKLEKVDEYLLGSGEENICQLNTFINAFILPQNPDIISRIVFDPPLKETVLVLEKLCNLHEDYIKKVGITINKIPPKKQKSAQLKALAVAAGKKHSLKKVLEVPENEWEIPEKRVKVSKSQTQSKAIVIQPSSSQVSSGVPQGQTFTPPRPASVVSLLDNPLNIPPDAVKITEKEFLDSCDTSDVNCELQTGPRFIFTKSVQSMCIDNRNKSIVLRVCREDLPPVFTYSFAGKLKEILGKSLLKLQNGGYAHMEGSHGICYDTTRDCYVLPTTVGKRRDAFWLIGKISETLSKLMEYKRILDVAFSSSEDAYVICYNSQQCDSGVAAVFESVNAKTFKPMRKFYMKDLIPHTISLNSLMIGSTQRPLIVYCGSHTSNKTGPIVPDPQCTTREAPGSYTINNPPRKILVGLADMSSYQKLQGYSVTSKDTLHCTTAGPHSSIIHVEASDTFLVVWLILPNKQGQGKKYKQLHYERLSSCYPITSCHVCYDVTSRLVVVCLGADEHAQTYITTYKL